MNSNVGTSKSVRSGDDKFEETVLKWFDECKSDESDIDNDVDNDFAIVSGHDTESENSESNDDESDNEVNWIASQLAADPKLQEMHRMAQAHKLKTGNIQSEELFCLFDTSTALKECPEITDDDSKTSIIAILVKIRCTNNYTDIYLSYMRNADYYYYNFIPIEDAITLLEKGMQLLTIQAEPSVQFIHLPSLLYFFADAFLHKTSVVERSKLIILTIADVEDDLVGIVLYENNTFKTLTSENSTNKFVNIDDAEVLVQLSHNCTKSEIEKILPIAIFIINDDYYYKTMSLSNSKMDYQ
ncbi:hypothetical protein QE152_g30231 [Popillia japonica]|uniref:Uncharacterized protein n=1 Tax=Popillia japonica TaxID=7064 RepID=A0AAW1JEU1_POPJA